MSQVRNLRAMFENKGDTSPPEGRGRSSGATTPTPGANGNESPRPLSKVRTNFVAIEKDGRIGLQRDPSYESTVSRRRLSTETDADSTTSGPERPPVTSDEMTKLPKLFVHETIPESPRQPQDAEIKPKETAPVPRKRSVSPVKKLDQVKPVASPVAAPVAAPVTVPVASPASAPAAGPVAAPATAPADPVAVVAPKPVTPEPAAPVAPVASKAPVAPVASSPSEPAPKSPTKAPKPAVAPAPVNGKLKAEKPKEVSSTTPAKTPVAKKNTTRPTAILTKPSSTKPPAKSPSIAKTPTSATSRHASNTTPKAQTKPIAKREPRAPSRTGQFAARSATTNVAKKPQSLKTSATETGFVKPKPKSPTKPVHLPASLMAPTASSVSKGSSSRQTQLRQSGSVANLNVPARSPSRTSVSTTTSTGKTVKRKNSTINRPSRPSLGPPPKKGNSDATVTKKDVPVDESFLARMMRPTQSSSSKTTDKVPITPPRKSTNRPSLSGSDQQRETHSRLGSTKKLSRRQAESSVPSDYAPSKELSPSPVLKASAVAVSEPVEDVFTETAVKSAPEQISQPLKSDVVADLKAAAEPKEVTEDVSPVEEVVEATANEMVEPVQQKVEPEPETVVEELAVETEKDDLVPEKPESVDEAIVEPEVSAENVIETKPEETIAVAEPEATTQEPETLEGTAVVEDEPIAKEAVPAVTETVDDQSEETKTNIDVDAVNGTLIPEAQKEVDVVVKGPAEGDKKVEAESISKGDSTA